APVFTAAVRHPLWYVPTPDWERLAADVVTAETIERLFGVAQPHRIDPHVVVSNREDFALRDANAGIESGGASLLSLHYVAQRHRERLDAFEHHVARVIGGVVIDNDH